MKQIYTNENRLLAINSRNVLESAGISVKLKNEFTAGSAIPGHTIWLELWVEDSDYEEAKIIIANVNANDDSIKLICGNCKEENDQSFKICWNCQNEIS